MKPVLIIVLGIFCLIGCQNTTDSHGDSEVKNDFLEIDSLRSVINQEDKVVSLIDSTVDSYESDSLITLINERIELEKDQVWTYFDTIDNPVFIESSEGAILYTFRNTNFQTYKLQTFGCSGQSVQYFFLNIDDKNRRSTNMLELHRTIETQYNSTLDSLNEENFEVFTEDSYFKNGKLVFQFSHDCGAPNSIEYQKSSSLAILNTLDRIGKSWRSVHRAMQ